MAHDQTTAHHESGTTDELRPWTYVKIGIFLTVVTLIELWMSYAEDLFGPLLVPLLLFLSAVKFGYVAWFYMHLKTDSQLLTRLFLLGLLLAAAILIALIALLR